MKLRNILVVAIGGLILAWFFRWQVIVPMPCTRTVGREYTGGYVIDHPPCLDIYRLDRWTGKLYGAVGVFEDQVRPADK